ncbi:PTS sugar transporter subunit IIA [Alkalicella caledoniensis]|uniref:Mannitol-specific phosphotransferase enzyme IIA component n=1 Tax=Alkalicella caledoniensis TaxID=2731377 RepID=A0A7G9W7R0_ALKCA|nr:PTS sugar transporter subunit IIA [Alkalicella caledoniensis]QNO14722.1 PTS sugar transporter subunit IIA [Alkalicella caledoniensis]
MISSGGTIALTGIFTLIIAYSLFGNRSKNKEKKILKVETKEKVSCSENIERIIFACDAGMGSSAMAASMLKSKLKDAGINAEVLSTAVSEIPQGAKLVISHEGLTPMARKIAKDAEHISIRDYFDDPAIDKLINRLKEGEKPTGRDQSDLNILKKENIKLNLASVTKNQAIKMAGELLVQSGYVDSDYIDAMYERESQLSTYIGKGVAIPHGIGKSKESIKKSGIVFLQFPQGVMFGEDVAHILIGIAGAGNEHLSILSNLASALDEDEIVEILQSTKDVDEVYNILTTNES